MPTNGALVKVTVAIEGDVVAFFDQDSHRPIVRARVFEVVVANDHTVGVGDADGTLGSEAAVDRLVGAPVGEGVAFDEDFPGLFGNALVAGVEVGDVNAASVAIDEAIVADP